MASHPQQLGTSRVDVLVIGAGPTGLTAAAEARRHGLSVRIVDKNPERTPFSKALVVHSRTMELLSDLGLSARVQARGREFRALNLYADRTPIARIDFQELDWQDAPYPFWLSIPQCDTELCLAEHLRCLGVEVEWSTQLLGVTQSPDHASARLLQEDGETALCEAHWLVACDGGRSDVRSALGIDFQGSVSDDVFILADVRMESDLADAEGYNLMARDGLTLIVPMPAPKQVRLILHMPELSAKDRPVITLELLQSLLDKRTGFKTRVSDLGWTSHFSSRHFLARHHRKGRIFLAGDAAHIHSPVGGQGLNTGIQDAYNLMWKLALYHKGHATAALLDSYEAERHPVAKATIKYVKRATRMLTLRRRIPQWVRNRLARILMNTRRVRDRLGRDVGMLSLSYKKSPVVAEDVPQSGWLSTLAQKLSAGAPRGPSSGPVAGELAPSRNGRTASGSPVRLLDVMRGTHHTLLLFAGMNGAVAPAGWSSAVAHLRQRYDAAIEPVFIQEGDARAPGLSGTLLCDPDAALHRRYGAQAPCLYLVRPDKYIAYRCQPVDFDRLRAYLDRVLVAKGTERS